MPNRARSKASRGRNRGQTRRGEVTAAHLHRRLMGRTFQGSFDPPATVDKPWNSAVIQLGGTGDTKVTPKLIVPVIISQMGLVSTQTLEMRVRNCRVWALDVSGRPLRVSFLGLTVNDASVLATMEDWGTVQHYPHVGYEWPASVQLYSWSTSQTAIVFSVDVSASVAWLAYLDLLWRSDQYTPITETVRSKLLPVNVRSRGNSGVTSAPHSTYSDFVSPYDEIGVDVLDHGPD